MLENMLKEGGLGLNFTYLAMLTWANADKSKFG
jgi:hypothetical protein